MIEDLIIKHIIRGLKDLYGQSISENLVQVQKTRQEFEGDRTINVFPLLKFSHKKPEETANDLGSYLADNIAEKTTLPRLHLLML